MTEEDLQKSILLPASLSVPPAASTVLPDIPLSSPPPLSFLTSTPVS